MRLTGYLLGCTALALTLAPASQASAEGAAAADDGVTSVQEVVITARKRSERLLDVPVAAAALDRAAIERYAATNLTSLVAQIPQVAIDEAASGNGAIISMRGIGSTYNDGGIDQEVTVNIDGVPISRGRIVGQASFDQQSVEVLKGPQALYFGKNSPAGVISINSTDPGRSFEGYGRAGWEFDAEEYFGEAAVSLPISDSLGARVALRASRMTGGYVQNTSGPITDPALLPYRLVQAGLTLPGAPEDEYTGSRDLIGRLTLKFTPTDRFDATLKVIHSLHEDDGYSMATVLFSCGPGQTAPMSLDSGNPTPGSYLRDPFGSCDPGFSASQGTIPAEVAAAYPGSNGGVPFGEVKSTLASVTANYRLNEALTLTSVSGYYKYTQRQWSNYDYSAFAIASGQNDDAWRAFTQELRLASDFEGPLNVTAGLFFQDDERTWIADGMVGYRGPDPTTGRWDSAASRGEFTGRTYSAFAELNWKITPTIELAGGARYTEEKKTGDMRNTFVHAAYANSFLNPATRLVGEFTEHNVSPQVTLSWHPMRNVMVFAAYRTGFKSGGFSSPTRYARTATVDNQRFGQEEVEGGEVGLKFSRGRLAGDFTVYRYVFEGLQLTAYNTQTTSYFTQNAGSALVRGAEGSLTFRATDHLTLRSSVGYNKARYREFPGAQCWAGQTAQEGCVGGVQDLGGMPLARSPKWNAIVGGTYEIPLGDRYSFALTADLRHSSGYYIQTSDSPYSFQKAFTVFDTSARLIRDDWEVALIGKNLTNEFYAVLGGDKPLGPRGQVAGVLGRPRQVVLQLTRRF